MIDRYVVLKKSPKRFYILIVVMDGDVMIVTDCLFHYAIIIITTATQIAVKLLNHTCVCLSSCYHYYYYCIIQCCCYRMYATMASVPERLLVPKTHFQTHSSERSAAPVLNHVSDIFLCYIRLVLCNVIYLYILNISNMIKLECLQ